MSSIDFIGTDPFADPDVPIPPRTRLYALPPAGMETPMQESLLSLIIRTARAHTVNPRRLVATVFPEVTPAFTDLAYATFFTRLAGTANGLGRYAELFVAATELLTGRPGLRQLTMLPWQELFPHNGQGLLARHPRWCPTCFAEQNLAGDDPVVPLAWSLEAVRICPKHRRPLHEHCPTCGRRQPFIPHYPDLSVCEHCHSTLATTGEFDTQKRETLTAFDWWAFGAVGDMLILPAGVEPSAERFREVLRERILLTADGNRAQFCREMGLQEWSLKGWLTKNERPSPAQFLAICYRLRSLPSRLFADAAERQTSPRRLIDSTLTRRAPCPRLTATSRRKLKRQLQECLARSEPTSLTAVGRNLGVSARCLRYWFPDICQLLGLKHQEWAKARAVAFRKEQQRRVQEVVREVCEAGEYPSRRRINRILQHERMALVLPHLLDAYLTAIAEYETAKTPRKQT